MVSVRGRLANVRKYTLSLHVTGWGTSTNFGTYDATTTTCTVRLNGKLSVQSDTQSSECGPCDLVCSAACISFFFFRESVFHFRQWVSKPPPNGQYGRRNPSNPTQPTKPSVQISTPTPITDTKHTHAHTHTQQALTEGAPVATRRLAGLPRIFPKKITANSQMHSTDRLIGQNACA